MIYKMLGLIASQEINAKEMMLSFEIPDNCFYVFSNNAGICVVGIKLNPGELEPSNTFVSNSETVDISSNVFEANFEQYEKSGNVIRKPKIHFEFI